MVFSLLYISCSNNNLPGESLNKDIYTNIGGDSISSLTYNRSPYRVVNSLVVDSTDTLSIEAGVQIYFEDSTKLFVRGKLVCSGSAIIPILFSSAKSSWKGIEIRKSSLQSVLRFVIVENIDVTMFDDSARYGAVEIVNANTVIQNSIFANNRSNNGGAIALDESQSLITNNIFINNYAVGFGGAILSYSSSNRIINNTFYRNESNNSAGGLLIQSPVLDEIQNNIFYQNTNRSGDPRISFIDTVSSHCFVRYNFLEAGSNPYFISTTNLHLSSNSPCIDEGNPDPQFNDADGTRNNQGAYGGPLGNW